MSWKTPTSRSDEATIAPGVVGNRQKKGRSVAFPRVYLLPVYIIAASLSVIDWVLVALSDRLTTHLMVSIRLHAEYLRGSHQRFAPMSSLLFYVHGRPLLRLLLPAYPGLCSWMLKSLPLPPLPYSFDRLVFSSISSNPVARSSSFTALCVFPN